MIALLPAATRQHIEHGPFVIDRIRPRLGFGAGRDPGFGPLGLVDHATLRGGAFIGLHEHRNDEIVSYLRSGTMHHFDNERGREALRADRLMVMNAGRGMWHEEQVPSTRETVEMLQIFLRPRAANFPPALQIQSLPAAASPGQWRKLVSPEDQFPDSGATFFVRSAVWIYDAHLAAHEILPLPAPPQYSGWLYVFNGEIEIAGRRLLKGDALAWADEIIDGLRAVETSDLVFFLVNRAAVFTREGTLSH